jgi:hypothetical protein
MANANLLLVEGKNDLHAVVSLMRHHMDWPDQADRRPVEIKEKEGIESILAPGYITAEIKSAVIKRLGIIIDADKSVATRYDQIRYSAGPEFSEFPPEMPEIGLILERPDGKRLGLWIMPDNRSDGTLETFLRYLVPERSGSLWNFAEESANSAREHGASYREVDQLKSQLHTFLAWHDPPGLPFGTALRCRVLDPSSTQAASFVAWFRELYEL